MKRSGHTPAVKGLHSCLAVTKAALNMTVRSAADAVEELDPTFPTWTTNGMPKTLPPDVAEAVAQLDRLVLMHREVIEEVVRLERRARRND